MKLRLLKHGKNLYMYCLNGTILIPSDDDLIRLLTSFSKPHLFKGKDGCWSFNLASMEEAAGETLAYIDDKNRLIVLNESVFCGILKQDTKYVSVSEYAEQHGKCRATIKNLCVAEKLPGAYKTSSGWLIPADTPYPKDGRAGRVVKKG